jgi:hypothetical protein
MCAAVDQLDRAPDKCVSSSSGYQDFVCLRGAHHPRRGVDVQPTDLLAAGLTRTGMDAGSNAEPQAVHCQSQRSRTADGVRGGVEPCEEAVTSRVDLRSAVGSQRTTDEGSIAGQQRVPTLVA